MKALRNSAERKIAVKYLCAFVLLLPAVLFSACSELEKPKPAPFYAETAPPAKKEFRWSNGKMPKTFDPARAAAPPETDVVRAIFEGLTETDPITLKSIPAIAESWSSAENHRVWTFNLRRNAKWSNGKSITAHDFVRSWKRAAEMIEPAPPHRNLLQNIVGMPLIEESSENPVNASEPNEFSSNQSNAPKAPLNPGIAKTPSQTSADAAGAPKETDAAVKTENSEPERKAISKKSEIKFGAEAVGDYALKVTLIEADRDFPALVAHPIFRPIFGDGKDFAGEKPNAGIVTSGAFRVVSIGQDGVTIDRAENYWNKAEVGVERVRFVPAENAEKSLQAYRAGEVDAVTNADIAPLALKLLMPYEDFRQTTHSALNFYEFNRTRPAFADRRVREAFAIAVARERLTEGDLEGASEPAFGFTPFHEAGSSSAQLTQNAEKAKQLLADAGFPNGENFPIVKLVVNRNDMQQRVARSVARMWKQHLNVETEIVVLDAGEIEAARASGDFDLLRRGVVLPTTDAAANMMAIFEPRKKIVETAENGDATGEKNQENAAKDNNADVADKSAEKKAFETFEAENGELILTEAEALAELSAIPLYFPTSYSLVKPYILGFETNALDAPLLRQVRIDNDWQPKENKGESK